MKQVKQVVLGRMQQIVPKGLNASAMMYCIKMIILRLQ